MEHEVGYRRPPRQHQFTKGQSGNPQGRPKGSKNAATVVEQELNSPITVTENGRRKKMTRFEFIFKNVVQASMKGDHKAVQSLLAFMRDTGQFAEVAELRSLLTPEDEAEVKAHLSHYSE